MADSSRIRGQGIQALAAGGLVTIETKDRSQERKQFVVSNIETVASGNIIYVCSTDGFEALPVFPQTSVTLETDSPFRIKNPTASQISYVVGELFFRGVTLASAAPAPVSLGGGSGGNSGQSSGRGLGNPQLP
jgi:hypothetical protein